MARTIAQQTGGNCAARAFSTMRLALGYDTGLPDGYIPNGPVRDVDMCAVAMRFFPDRNVLVWCHWRFAHGVEDIQWMGETFKGNYDSYIVAFNYYTNQTCQMAHVVIGYPQLYGHMKTQFVFAVKI